MRKYLPSSQLTLFVLSLALSAGLVYAAETSTNPRANSLTAVSSEDAAAAAAHANWEATLSAIQAQAGATLPAPPDPGTVATLLQAAQNGNMTDTVGRSLLVNLGSAKAQGLGDDIPTQNQLVSQAIAQMKQDSAATAYTAQDLTIVDDSKETQHNYGNALASTVAEDQGSEYGDTMVIIDAVTSSQDGSQLKQLEPIKARYQTLVENLRRIPVPRTLAPFHLQLVNNLKAIVGAYGAMEQLTNDPLRGLAGLQSYKSLTDETMSVFINIAQSLHKDGILFNKDEPGAAWASLLSGQ